MTDYTTLRLSIEAGVATICFDNGDINLFDGPMIGETMHVVSACAGADDVRVIVFKSANPDFFIAHVDLNLLDGVDLAAPEGELPAVPAFMKMLRTIPKITIAQIEDQRAIGTPFVG